MMIIQSLWLVILRRSGKNESRFIVVVGISKKEMKRWFESDVIVKFSQHSMTSLSVFNGILSITIRNVRMNKLGLQLHFTCDVPLEQPYR